MIERGAPRWSPPFGAQVRALLARPPSPPQVASLRLLRHHVSGLLADLLTDAADWLAAWDHCVTWWAARGSPGRRVLGRGGPGGEAGGEEAPATTSRSRRPAFTKARPAPHPYHSCGPDRRGPQFMWSLLAAYLVAFRQQLLAAADPAALERFFSAARPLDVQKARK